MKISDEASVSACSTARRVLEGELKLKQGINYLVEQHGLNRNTATDYIRIFAAMANGAKYSRTNNLFSTDHFLDQLHQHYGNDGLCNGLAALMQHIEYYEGLTKGNMVQHRAIYAKYAALVDTQAPTLFPDEVSTDEPLVEGASAKVSVNVYERNPIARKKCIEHYGCVCIVCEMDFGKTYGTDIGKGFIHVHHVIDIATIKKEYEIDPIKDLRPLCPNCHAMVHRERPAMSVEALKARLTSATRP